MSIRIVTDSTCDLPLETVQRLGITVVPLHIHAGDHTYLDGVDLTREEFYTRLPKYVPHPKTAAPGPEVFTRIYERLANEGAQAILSIHISESLSGTINSARAAAEEFTRIPVTVLDSGQLSLGTGFLVEKAAQLAQVDKLTDQILSALQNTMKHTYVFASLKTLEYLRRSGRMHFALANLGEILQIKPLLHMHLGKPTAHRVRTQKRATEQVLAWLNEYAPYEKLAVLHAGVTEEAQRLREQVRSYFPDSAVPVVQITPVLGAHLGIGALGFACISKE
ncbi:MAG: DegV family protein [Chloroflexi bacterium]|nr:DegV family protein [Chloroflexota bacterium]